MENLTECLHLHCYFYHSYLLFQLVVFFIFAFEKSLTNLTNLLFLQKPPPTTSHLEDIKKNISDVGPNNESHRGH